LYLRSEKFNEIEIYNLISRKELAELSAISLDSTMKIINELKNDKIIEVNGKEIIIKDLEMMVRLAQIG
jgi:CRP-like cAMP-binding protein